MTVLTSAIDVKMAATCCGCTQPPDDEAQKEKTVWRFMKKIFLSQVFRSLRSKKPKASEDETPNLRRESFYLSTVSLEKRRPSEQSIDTIITLLDETCTFDNRVNEKIEQMTYIEDIVEKKPTFTLF